MTSALTRFRLSRVERSIRTTQAFAKLRLGARPNKHSIMRQLARSGESIVWAIDEAVKQVYHDSYREQIAQFNTQLTIEGVNVQIPPQRTQTEIAQSLYEVYPSFHEQRGYDRLTLEDDTERKYCEERIERLIATHTDETTGIVDWRAVMLAMLMYQYYKAMTNAKTNCQRYQEYGKHQCASDIKDNLQIITQKRWDSVLIPTTREHHEEADGQIVDVDGHFDVGGEAMRFPLDQGGSAGNVINCLCSVYYMLLRPDSGWQLVIDNINRQIEAQRERTSTRL